MQKLKLLRRGLTMYVKPTQQTLIEAELNHLIMEARLQNQKPQEAMQY